MASQIATCQGLPPIVASSLPCGHEEFRGETRFDLRTTNVRRQTQNALCPPSLSLNLSFFLSSSIALYRLDICALPSPRHVRELICFSIPSLCRAASIDASSLTLVADRTQQVLGPSSVHYFDSNRLARSHLRIGLEPYRQRLANRSFGYAADLVHFNPLKEWPLVQEMVVDAGCGFFPQPLNRPPRPDWMPSLQATKGL